MDIVYTKPYVKLVNRMEASGDRIPSKTARLSYFKYEENRNEEDDLKLASYLLWHKHTSPFEHLEFSFEIHCPLFVRNQILRHRTANVNEVSRRYTAKDMSFYRTSKFRYDEKKEITDYIPLHVHPLKDWEDEILPTILSFYDDLVKSGVPLEQARQFLPQNMMTTFIWKMDLHNLFHFLSLRTSYHAQEETRNIAFMILEILEEEVPGLVNLWITKNDMEEAFRKVFYEEFKQRVETTRKGEEEKTFNYKLKRMYDMLKRSDYKS